MRLRRRRPPSSTATNRGEPPRRAVPGGPSALVWDVGTGEVERAAEVITASDPVLLVADGSREPALAELVTDMLTERFGRVLLVANRVGNPERWERRAVTCLPGSRIGAALVARGRRSPGAFWAAVSELRTY